MELGTTAYNFTVAWSDEDGGYIAVCPKFPGLSAFGITQEEEKTELQVALGGAMAVYQEQGWALPVPDSFQEAL